LTGRQGIVLWRVSQTCSNNGYSSKVLAGEQAARIWGGGITLSTLRVPIVMLSKKMQHTYCIVPMLAGLVRLDQKLTS
jgi:hypothetical protein